MKKSTFIQLSALAILITFIAFISLPVIFTKAPNPFVLVFLKDSSKSAITDTDFSNSIKETCKVIINDLSEDTWVTLVNYADYAATSNQWVKKQKLTKDECNSLDFNTSRLGTRPELSIEKALDLLQREPQKTIKPLVIFTVQADEPETASPTHNHNAVVNSLRNMAKLVQERSGMTIVISGSYEKLERDLQKDIKNPSIYYCSSKRMKICNIGALINNLQK